MLFCSPAFAVFFPISTLGYFALPHRARWAWLLAASICFYASFIPVYVFVLLFLIAWDYASGLAIAAARGRRRKLLLAGSLAANVATLAAFKYSAQLGAWTGLPSFAMPLGLSFHTFQSMAYTIEVYRGSRAPERHVGIYALYVMFYPQLAAGPIERPGHLLPQLHAEHRFDAAKALGGVRLMLAGFFKKAVIADSLAVIVSRVYERPDAYRGDALCLATVLFAFQIFCDFSGYSDIARGAARVMGIELVENFEAPLLASSLPEFWRRWHVSLMSWFRDYVYIPLGGSRVPEWRRRLNLLIVFLISGMWHGGHWNFVFFGALHGLAMIAYLASTPLRRAATEAMGPAFARIAGTAATFAFFAFSLIFFRAETWSDAWHIAARLGSMTGSPACGASELVLAAALIASLALVAFLRRDGPALPALAGRPAWQRWSVSYVVGLSLVGLTLARVNHFAAAPRQFIYFQF